MLFSMYDYILKRPYGYCIYNTLSSMYVKIEGERDVTHFEQLLKVEDLSLDDEMVQKLYERGFVVGNDVDEFQLAKSKIDELDKKASDMLECLIYVTDNCNFRCVYCPEEHINNNLSDEKWEAFYKYIRNNIEKENKKLIKINFFGGEPLLQINKILTFLQKLKTLVEKHNVKVKCDFTSNGYLLTPDIYDKLNDIGFEYFFQITVDGFAEQHNKTRPLANGAGTWDKIIENLKYANTVDDNIKIMIRTNMGPDNVDVVQDFHRWAGSVFTNNKFKFHIEPVAKYSERVEDKYTLKVSAEDVAEMEEKAASEVETYELRGFEVLSGACHTAHTGFVTIAVNGAVYKCENNYLYDSNHDMPIGYLSDDGEIVYNVDINEIEKYEYERCETCGVYPICGGRSCPVRKMFNPEARMDCLEKGLALEDALIKKIESGALDRFEKKNLFVKANEQ